MRTLSLLLVLWCFCSLLAEDGPLVEFQRGLAEDFADLPEDDPTRQAVVALSEQLAAAKHTDVEEWHLNTLRTSLEIAQVLRRLTTVDADIAGHALVQTIQMAGSAADTANRGLVATALTGHDDLMNKAAEEFGVVINRWYRLHPVIELALTRAEWDEVVTEMVAHTPEDERPALAERRQAVLDRLQAAALALRAAQQRDDVVAELTAIGAVRAAGVDLEWFQFEVELAADLRSRPVDAAPAPELLARLQASVAALAATRHALIATETQRQLVEYREEGLWDRQFRLDEAVNLLRDAWVDGAVQLEDEPSGPTIPDRDLDRQP